MTKFSSPGCQPVDAGSAVEAARIFAGRGARREYGRGGYARTIRLDCWTEDRRSCTFEAYIGRDVDDKCAGRSVWIYVDEQEG